MTVSEFERTIALVRKDVALLAKRAMCLDINGGSSDAVAAMWDRFVALYVLLHQIGCCYEYKLISGTVVTPTMVAYNDANDDGVPDVVVSGYSGGVAVISDEQRAMLDRIICLSNSSLAM